MLRGVVAAMMSQAERRKAADILVAAEKERKQAVQLSGTESLVAFNATSNVMRHFCSVCGSHVFTADRRYPKVLGVPAGIIESHLASEPKAHYFVSHKAAWHTISDGLPQFGGESGVEPTAA